jgi:hypothetical protein
VRNGKRRAGFRPGNSPSRQMQVDLETSRAEDRQDGQDAKKCGNSSADNLGSHLLLLLPAMHPLLYG